MLADAEKSLLVSLAPCGGEALTRLTRLTRVTRVARLARFTRLARLARFTRLARVERSLPDNAIYQLLSAFVGSYLFRFFSV